MRKYGQHFLVSPSIIEGIVDAVPSEVSSVLEIGPGRGALTEKLLARKFPHFTAVEIDPDMEQYLLQHFPAIAGRLVRADFMQIDLQKLPQQSTFVVSNLPYIDAADILDKVLGWSYFAGAVFMFQKEQAGRILASAGQEGYGPLSILTQVRSTPKMLLKVGKACFNPPPKVESSVLTFAVKPWLIAPAVYNEFARFIKAAFMHRRKTLFNSLVLSGYDKNKIEHTLTATNLLPTVRAQDVSVEQFLSFFTDLTLTALL